jgi:hypothetical protein
MKHCFLSILHHISLSLGEREKEQDAEDEDEEASPSFFFFLLFLLDLLGRVSCLPLGGTCQCFGFQGNSSHFI